MDTSGRTDMRSCRRRCAPRPRPRPNWRAPRSWPNPLSCQHQPARADRGANHTGALAVVFTGLPGGDMVMPVRLPQGAGQWAHLHHFLADPAIWHKIDLVRVRDRKAPGGWRYYAHLLTHNSGYACESALKCGAPAIPADRRAGLDANVSNLALVSFPAAHPEQLAIDQIRCDTAQQQAATRAAKRGPGPSACPGPLPTQHQPRAVRAVGAATETGTPPRRQRVASQTGHQPGRDPSRSC